MPEGVEEVVAALAAGEEPLLRNVSGTVQWRVDGEEPCNVILDRGAIHVDRAATSPDCVISCSPDTFLALAGGEQNSLTGFLQGRVRIEGDIALSQALLRVFARLVARHAMASDRGGDYVRQHAEHS